MEYRYKPGDAVLVIKTLTDQWAKYYMRSGPRANAMWEPATTGMCELKGQMVHIKKQTEIGSYLVEEDPDSFNWTDEMFELTPNECLCENLL